MIGGRFGPEAELAMDVAMECNRGARCRVLVGWTTNSTNSTEERNKKNKTKHEIKTNRTKGEEKGRRGGATGFVQSSEIKEA
jgi:hypothetical protein